MRTQDIARLILLAAIWGSSFLFMRWLSPIIGPVTTATGRVLIAGLLLTVLFLAAGLEMKWRENLRFYFLIGVVQSAIPFLLFCFAALVIPASYSAVINSTTPIFGMLLSALILGDRFTRTNVLGGFLGMFGVALITGLGPVEFSGVVMLAVVACMGAAMCYAFASVLMKVASNQVPPKAMAAGSQLLAGFVLLPASFAYPPTEVPSLGVILGVAAMAILCSAIAFLIFYRLIADCGPSKPLTVTFIIPVFGILWGRLFLNEVITTPMLIGCAFVILGTVLVVRDRIVGSEG